MIRLSSIRMQVWMLTLLGLFLAQYEVAPATMVLLAEAGLSFDALPGFSPLIAEDAEANGSDTFIVSDGSFSWDGPRQVGNDWVFDQIVPGGGGLMYAVEGDGDLLWYDHLGSALGTFRWTGPRDVGDGWHIPSSNPSPCQRSAEIPPCAIT